MGLFNSRSAMPSKQETLPGRTVRMQVPTEHFVNGRGLTEGVLNRIEAGIRAYDPCLSCSTHALGQMPIIVEFVDPAGTVTETLRRD